MTNIVELVETTTQRHPKAVALRMADRSLTYSELLAEIEKVAGGLKKLGLTKGDRVGIFAENCPEYLILYLAAAKIGAVFATINPGFKDAEIGYILTNSQPRIIFVQAALEQLLLHCYNLSAHKPEHTVRIGVGNNSIAVSYDKFLTLGVCKDSERVDPDDGVVICYTSGSMSRPKPVFKSHRAEAFLARAHAKTWHMGVDDTVFVALPLSWLFGLTTSSLACLSAGGTVLLTAHFNPVVALAQMAQFRVTVFAGVMTMFAKIMQVADQSATDYDLSSLRFCVQGGEPRNEALAERFYAKFAVAIHDIYATSECCPNFTYDPYQDPKPRHGSCGRLVEGVEARILGADGEEVSDGQPGELVVRCPGLMIGYFREPELTAEVIKDGWFLSRDLVRLDKDGYYYVVGRTKELIIRGGANIAPAEVESVITSHPAVAEAAVVGQPDEIYGEQPIAFVVLRTEHHAAAEELQKYCGERLAKFKVPTKIFFLEHLPKGATGKVLKAALRDTVVEL